MLTLSSAETAALVEPRLLLAEIRDALAQPAPPSPATQRVELDAHDRTRASLPLRAPGVPAYAIRVDNEHLLQPRIVTYLLHDNVTGARLAHIDGAFLSSVATGCVAALGASVGARVGLLGAGEAGAATIWMLRHLRALDEVLVHDVRAERAEAFARGLTAELELPVRVAAKDEVTALPLVFEDAALHALPTDVAQLVALWHVFLRAREVSTKRPTTG